MDEFNVLRKLSGMQTRHMQNEPFLASNEMGDMLKGIVHSFKFHVNKQTIIYLCNRLFNYFDEGTIKILPSFMFNSFKFANF